MLDLTQSIRLAVANENWLAALFMALCMPDICAAIETPDVKVGERYKRWFSDNLGPDYFPMFSADDCYYFRCSCLHQGLDKHPGLVHERIHFITPPPRRSIVHLNKLNDVLQMQIDIFCTDVADAVDAWYENVAKHDEGMGFRMKTLIKIHTPDSLRPFIPF